MDKDTEITEDNGKNTGKDPITGRFVEGNKLGGKTPGALSFQTKWATFIDKVAKSNNLTPQEIDEQLFAVGFKKAKEGDYAFYRDLHDRLYGKPQQTLDVTTDGEKINTNLTPEQIALALEYENKLKGNL